MTRCQINMVAKLLPILATLVLSCVAQSPYVRRPVGYPVLESTTTSTTTTQNGDLSDRAGNDLTTMATTAQWLPSEALGNRAMVDALSKLPADRQPFWLLNRQALEEQRNRIQTYDQRPSIFIDSLSSAGAQQGSLGSQRPQNFAQTPQDLAQTPQTFAQSPQNFAQSPQNFAQSPQNFVQAPQNFVQTPQNLAQTPQTFAQSPQNFARSPQNFAQSPQNFGQAPQNFIQTPQSFVFRQPNTNFF